jgi:integrase/recombinase XerC
MAEQRLDADITAVCQQWMRDASSGLMSLQSADKFSLLARRYARYATACGVVSLDGADRRIAEGFITARGRNRHGHISDSALATHHLRRSVLRVLYRTARSLGLTEADPTMDVNLPPKTRQSTRPLTDEEALLVRRYAESRIGRTRHAAAVALADAGAHTGEIGHLSVADLDLDHERVWVHGSSKTAPRWRPLDRWQLHVLSERARELRSRNAGVPDEDLPLATSGRGTDAQLQARVCVALNDVMTWAGLAGEADLRPGSITLRRAASAFAETGRIEDAATCLGFASLDRAATAIGYDWRSRTPDMAPPRRPRAARRFRDTDAR